MLGPMRTKVRHAAKVIQRARFIECLNAGKSATESKEIAQRAYDSAYKELYKEREIQYRRDVNATDMFHGREPTYSAKNIADYAERAWNKPAG